MFHGTSESAAKSIIAQGLGKGQYVTDDFDLAASYALRTDQPAIAVVKGEVSKPDEIAYDDIEFVAAEMMQCLQVLRPTFSGKPIDWYELDGNLERVHPELFSRESWR
jgi:hypothetical protein